MLEASGMSRANPYNIVPQGKVDALVLMKDADRLDMFKDIGGVTTYEERRIESLKVMEETCDKQNKVGQTLQYIGTRLRSLEEEKEELVQVQGYDRKRKMLAYTYYDNELKKAANEIDLVDMERSES